MSVVSLVFLLLCVLATIECQVFDTQSVVSSLWLSCLAYCPSDEYGSLSFASAFVKGFVITKQFHEPKLDISGFIGVRASDRHIYVAFRGSEANAENWLAVNFKMKMVAYRWGTLDYCTRCEVHEGFWNAYSHVRETIAVEVDRLTASYPQYRVVVTGHSMGGALATLFAVDAVRWVHLPPSRVRLITFGAPKLFNLQSAEMATHLFGGRSGDVWSRQTVYRVTHYHDPIPVYPRVDSQGSQPYVQVAGEWYQGPNINTTVACTSSYESPACIENQGLLDFSFDNHRHYLGYPISDCNYCSQN